MDSSSEQIDDLLEWHPGSPDAARAAPLQALLWGVRRAADARVLLFWLWLAHLLVAQRGAASLLAALRAPLGWTDAYEVFAAASASSSSVAPGFLSAFQAISLSPITRPLWSADPFFVLFHAALAGGAIAWLHASRSGALLPQLGAGCGRYLGRFTRLLAIAALLFWALQRGSSVMFASTAAAGTSRVPLVLWPTTLLLLATILDYARVRAVARDSRSMVLEVLRSTRFFLLNLPRTLTLLLAWVVLAVAAAMAAWGIASVLLALLPETSALLASRQIYVLMALWIRLAGWAALLSLYQGITLEKLARNS